MTRLQECLSYNLQYYRKLRGFTQEQLAEKVGTSVNYMGLVERGKNAPSFPMLERIAVALEIDSTQLFEPSDRAESFSSIEKTLISEIERVIHTTFKS